MALFATAGGCGNSNESNKSTGTTVDGKVATPASGDAGLPSAPKVKGDPQHPIVVIDTNLGKITVELDRNKALLTVDKFLQYVNSSFYDQTIIHQVSKGAGIIGGGYDTKMGAKQVHPPVRNEANPNGLKNLRGTIAMIRQPKIIDSATSQFFINVADNPTLDYRGQSAEEYGFCVFGKVIDGLDVVDAISGVATHDVEEFVQTPKEQVVVKSIRLIR